jgi:hypothetical protein
MVFLLIFTHARLSATGTKKAVDLRRPPKARAIQLTPAAWSRD